MAGVSFGLLRERGGGGSYSAAVRGVDSVDEVDGEVVLVWCPGDDIVAALLER